MELETLAAFYGNGSDQLHLAFNFPFMFAGLDAGALGGVVQRTEELMPAGASLVWALSNHDVVRFPTRICEEDDARVKCALVVLLGLHGTPVLYYGDELGLHQVEIPDDVDWRAPWLPPGRGVASVAAQREDPGSVLSFCRELVALRRRRNDLSHGLTSSSTLPPGSGPGGADRRPSSRSS